MLKKERQQKILEILHEERRIIASELPELFGVSIDTIRRDLEQLEIANKLQRTHGGALPRSTVPESYEGRVVQSLKGKEEVAYAALSLLQPKQVIIIDGGTTALELAKRLPKDYEGTVVTHSPGVVATLAQHENIEIIIIGGKYDKRARVAFGPDVVKSYESIKADICFLGVASLHAEVGIGALYYEELLVRQTLIRSSNQIVALATNDKFGIITPYIVDDVKAISYIATEKEVPNNLAYPFEELGIPLLSINSI